ncbi:MAG: rod shape-determining protein MreC [Desulfitobacteriaceae bacterium]|nr:rod shape-determining protein MreC [Desulfitobacteriaceae bacterium]
MNITGITVLVFFLLLAVLVSMRLTGPGTNFPNPVGRTMQLVLNPIEKGILTVGNTLKRNTKALWSFSKVEQENLSLRQQVDQLTSDNLRLKEQVLAGMRFEDLNEGLFRSPTLDKFEKVGASIINRNPTAWYQTITVNRGTKDGIEINDAVIAQLGLVGKVVTVYPESSEVLLISDGEAQVGALVRSDTGTAAYGIVQGTYKRSSRLTAAGNFQMLFRREDYVNVSDLVLTSGLGGVYPKDIPIGKIKQIMLEDSGLLKIAYIEPLVDFDSLEEVIIVKTMGENDALFADCNYVVD